MQKVTYCTVSLLEKLQLLTCKQKQIREGVRGESGKTLENCRTGGLWVTGQRSHYQLGRGGQKISHCSQLQIIPSLGNRGCWGAISEVVPFYRFFILRVHICNLALQNNWKKSQARFYFIL